MADRNVSDAHGQRVLVVGCGGMSRTWLRYLVSRDELEVVGLVDLEPEAAAARAAEAGLEVPHFTELAAALAQTEPTVVCDVTIPEAHAGVATVALQAGCHVACEKPMAHSLEAAHATSALAAAAGLNYAIMQNRRYRPAIRAVRDIVASGALADLGIVNADFYLGPHFGGFRDAMQSPLLLDMAIHTFDQARFITGRRTLCWDGDGPPRTELIGGGEATAPAPYTGPEGHAGCLQEMFAAIAAGRPAETSYGDNIKSLAMVFGAIESARRGARVEIAELLQ